MRLSRIIRQDPQIWIGRANPLDAEPYIEIEVTQTIIYDNGKNPDGSSWSREGLKVLGRHNVSLPESENLAEQLINGIDKPFRRLYNKKLTSSEMTDISYKLSEEVQKARIVAEEVKNGETKHHTLKFDVTVI